MLCKYGPSLSPEPLCLILVDKSLTTLNTRTLGIMVLLNARVRARFRKINNLHRKGGPKHPQLQGVRLGFGPSFHTRPPILSPHYLGQKEDLPPSYHEDEGALRAP